MAKNAFSGKHTPAGGQGISYDDVFLSGIGYTFANTLDEKEAALEMIGMTEPAEGHVPVDTFKAVDPVSYPWSK